jgi:hypothetical protein
MAVDYDLSGVPKPVALAAKYALVVAPARTPSKGRKLGVDIRQHSNPRSSQ